MSNTVFTGIIRGKTIELNAMPELPDGAEVTVTVQPLVASPSSPEAWEALKRAAGGWAADAKELDEYLEWNRQQRKGSRREIAE